MYRSNSLSIDEQERLINATTSYEDLALFKLALSTGIRRDDIVNILIENIDFDNNILKFYEQKKSRILSIPLSTEVISELKRYIASKPKSAKTRKQKSPQRYLFTFSGRTAYNKLQAGLERAGIDKTLRFHDLRRTFMKTAKKKGMSMQAVAQISGDTLRTIEQFYIWLDMDELHDEVRKLEKAEQ